MTLSFSTRAVRGAACRPNRRGLTRCRPQPGCRHRQSHQELRSQEQADQHHRRLHRRGPVVRDKLTGPEGFAYSKGLFQKWLKPDKVTIKSTAVFANGPLLTAALVGGSLQLGELGDTPAIVGESPLSGSSDNTRIINQEQVGLQAVLITQKNVTSLSQLANQNLYRQPQSYMDRWVQAYLKSKGLLSQVKLAPGLLAQFIPEFNSGQIPTSSCRRPT